MSMSVFHLAGGRRGREEEGTLTAGSWFSVCSIQLSSVSKSLGPWYFTASWPGLKNFRLKGQQWVRKLTSLGLKSRSQVRVKQQ